MRLDGDPKDIYEILAARELHWASSHRVPMLQRLD